MNIKIRLLRNSFPSAQLEMLFAVGTWDCYFDKNP
jgi:hypothetical protein